MESRAACALASRAARCRVAVRRRLMRAQHAPHLPQYAPHSCSTRASCVLGLRRRWRRSGGCACWRTGTRRASGTARTLRRWQRMTSSCARTASWSTTARSRARRAAPSGARALPQRPLRLGRSARGRQGVPPAAPPRRCSAAPVLASRPALDCGDPPSGARLSSSLTRACQRRMYACAHTSARQCNMSLREPSIKE